MEFLEEERKGLEETTFELEKLVSTIEVNVYLNFPALLNIIGVDMRFSAIDLHPGTYPAGGSEMWGQHGGGGRRVPLFKFTQTI